MKYAKLFTPVKIGNVTIKNRFAMAPMGPLGLADADGGFNQRGIDYYTERAKGGTGLIITGVTFVENEIEEHGMPNCPCSTHNPVHFVRTAREMTERIHAYNAKVFLQMSGGFGRVTIPTNLGEFPPVAPSPIQHRWLDKTCRALTTEEIRSIVKKFGEGAYNAKRAGFDGVQIHAVHEGYLIDQFAIALFNQRTDEYGGSLENRLRFAKEIVEEIKERCGKDFVVTLRYSPKSFIKELRVGGLPGEEFEEKGRDLEEGVEAAKLLVAYGYDALDTDVGSYDAWWWSHPPMYQEKGLYRPYCKLMKENVDVPVICAGRMDDPDMALEAIENGTCDMISMGRPLLADPDYCNKLRSGRMDEIRPCISCQEGCMGRIQEYSMINCAVNPQAARERFMAYTPILKAKKVMVIGGGVAGCEAARVLATRGHKPEVFEATDHLGGNLIPGGAPDFKEDDIALAKWFKRQLELLEVPVHYNTKVTKEMVLAGGYDAVVCATGSTPKMFPLGDDEKVYSAADVLTGAKEAGDTMVVVGGGLVGCETALWLAQKGKKVTIVEALPKILALNGPLCHANSEMLERLIPFHGIEVVCGARVTGYKDGYLSATVDGEEKKIPCDGVILSVGYRENNSLYQELEFEVPEIYQLGDAKKVANIMYAIWDAFEVANHI
ncbi:FAD-dependent oxidoreductase [Cuneatibacter sp. NSJ-177]|uniref:oxidoreductase n=1 Tax=Cuneatibacter sp. NSJ-177 TaxID=2931401 RepID=UPI001FD3C5BA|nr:FAD-dependent oxidoreductase [Cuneatibacter sp. NSJ-177]MCJ7834381.1 FAD-dependent oxidoreductase [Cuneatibacter sp. NSJ-177]